MKSKAGLGDWECYRGLVHGALLTGVGSTGFVQKVCLNTDLKARKSATKTWKKDNSGKRKLSAQRL